MTVLRSEPREVVLEKRGNHDLSAHASKVSGLWAQGQYAEAQKAADDAKKWAIWGAIAGVIVAIIYVLIAVVGGGISYMNM